jgi:hypothetical protein
LNIFTISTISNCAALGEPAPKPSPENILDPKSIASANILASSASLALSSCSAIFAASAAAFAAPIAAAAFAATLASFTKRLKNCFIVTNVPSLAVTVLATIIDVFSIHRLVSINKQSSVSTHTSPSHLARVRIVDPSLFTISVHASIALTFVIATFPLTVVSSNRSSSCATCRSSFKSIRPANLRVSATPTASTNASAFSVYSVSHTPLRAHHPSVIIVVVVASPFDAARRSRPRASFARVGVQHPPKVWPLDVSLRARVARVGARGAQHARVTASAVSRRHGRLGARARVADADEDAMTMTITRNTRAGGFAAAARARHFSTARDDATNDAAMASGTRKITGDRDGVGTRDRWCVEAKG